MLRTDIADALGMTVSGVKKLMHKAGMKSPYPENAIEILQTFRTELIKKQRASIAAALKTDVARAHMSKSHNMSAKGKRAISENMKMLAKTRTLEEKRAIHQKASSHKYIIDNVGFDSRWEAMYYLWLTYSHRDNKGIYYGQSIIKDYPVQLPHGTYFVDFKIANSYVEIKGPHFFNDDGQLIVPFNNPSRVQDEHSAEKQAWIKRHNVTVINDMTWFEKWLNLHYGKGFVDLFDYSTPFPFNEPIYKCRRKGCKTPYEAWFIPELRQKAIFNRLMWGPFGRMEKENWSNGIFTPKHSNIEPKDIVQAFTIARIAPKVSELRESKINLGNAKSVVNPFCGFGACIRKCKKNGISVKAYDIQNICNEDVTIADITTITDETPYDLLFACPPYSDKETWTVEMPVIKNCDEWIDECFRAFPNCKEYRFIVDYTEKYVDNISNSISNKNHLCSKSKEIELFFLKNQIK